MLNDLEREAGQNMKLSDGLGELIMFKRQIIPISTPGICANNKSEPRNFSREIINNLYNLIYVREFCK